MGHVVSWVSRRACARKVGTALRFRSQSTRILLSTEVTPGAAKAVDPAKRRPTQVSTVPVSCSVPPSAVTLIVAGLNHERRSAIMIECLILDASNGTRFDASSTACFNCLSPDMVFS